MSTFQGKESVFRSQHAVVIGGSIAGLLAGRALADHFDVVTIIERDRFPQSVAVRKGVPQAQHNHALLSKGMLIMQKFFPNLFPTLLQRGSTRLDTSLDLEWYQHGVWKMKVATGIDVYSQSRPLIEDEIRHQLARHENVRFMDACEVTQLCTNEDKTRISGVHIQYHDGQAKKETLQADLVIDASGRGSQTSRWFSCLVHSCNRVKNSQTMFVVTETSDRLVSTSERGPGQTLEKRHGPADQEGKEESSHFRHAQRDHYRQASLRMRLNSSSVLEGECSWEDFSCFFSSGTSESGSAAWLWARKTLRKACASMHSVM